MTPMTRVRPRALAAVFGGYVVAIFLAAGFFAKDLQSAWFGADLSRWVYFAYLLGAAALIAGMGAAMAARTTYLDRRIQQLGDRIRDARGNPGPGAPAPIVAEGRVPRDSVDRDIDDLLESLSEMEATSAAEAEVVGETGDESLVAGPTGSHGGEAAQDLVVERERVRGVRRALRAYFLGPAAIAVVFLGISGAMIPGVETFLQTSHQLNATLILGMGYGWIGLGAYVIAAVAAHLRET